LVDAEAWQYWGKTKLIFSAPSLSKNRSRATSGNYRRYKQIQQFSLKKWNIACNIIYFIMNVIIARQIFSAHPIYLSFSAIVRICFEAGI